MGFADAGNEALELGLSKPHGQGVAQDAAFAGDDEPNFLSSLCAFRRKCISVRYAWSRSCREDRRASGSPSAAELGIAMAADGRAGRLT
jgi:hypothetical protein